MGRSRKKKSPPRGCRQQPVIPEFPVGVAAFRQMMERAMNELAGGLPPDGSPRARAQDLVYDAMETEGPQQVHLAKKALKIDPDCADALVLLAENAGTLPAAVDLYRQGVRAAERSLGGNFLEKYAGYFWATLETRPYMRARAGLADCLWRLGRREEAVEHYQEMLNLNPGDNQGIRYRLINHLLELDRTSEAEALLERYADDGAAEWFYSSALLAFRRSGDSQDSRRLLARARRANKHVPALLLGQRQMPQFLPEYIQPGHADEAVSYVSAALPVWRSVPGAITWVRTHGGVKVKPTAPPKKEPPASEETRAKRLPQNADEVWQLGIAASEGSAESGDKQSPAGWIALLLDRTSEMSVTMDMFPDRPRPEESWNLVLKGMRSPEEGDPRRPGTIHVRDEALHHSLEPRLARIGVACQLVADLDMADFFLHQMQSRMGAGAPAIDGEKAAGELAQLPQEADVWQVDVRRMPIWTHENGRHERPWLVLVVGVEADLVLSTRLQSQPWSTEAVWQVLAGAMLSPAAGLPHRPRRVVFRSAPLLAALKPRLEALGIAAAMADCLEHWEQVFQSLICGPFADELRHAMFAGDGVTREQVGDVFAAAAEFYRQSPWRRTPSDVVLRLDCPEWLAQPWYAAIIGQNGVAIGLALYFDLKYLKFILAGQEPTETAMRQIDGLSVMFEEQYELAAAEVNAAEEEAWPVATPEAWPLVIRVLPKMNTRPPSGAELAVLEASLRAVAEFVTRHGPFPAPAEGQVVSVSTAAGRRDVRLEWVKSK